MLLVDRDLIRGGHYGQRSCEPHPKAEHMAAPTNAVKREKSSCQSEAVHTWHKADQQMALTDVRFRRDSERGLSPRDAARSCMAAILVEDYFFFSVLNETPSRIATLRMRSGLRFMIRAASSKDFDALASSITRRSFA
jgi:hypothetical protein